MVPGLSSQQCEELSAASDSALLSLLSTCFLFFFLPDNNPVGQVGEGFFVPVKR